MESYQGNEPYIFVSYSHKDSKEVEQIIEVLENHRYRIWYDEGIEPGSEWPEFIAQRLNESAVVLAFISNEAINSNNCRNEINYAISKNKPFIWVMLSKTQMTPGMELQLSSQQCIIKYQYEQEDFYNKLEGVSMFDSCKQEKIEEAVCVDKENAYIMNYPYLDLCDYFTSNWILDELNYKWLRIEQVIKEKQKKADDMRSREIEIEDVSYSKSYFETIDHYASTYDPFYKNIKDSCIDTYDDETKYNKWDLYVSRLYDKVCKNFESDEKLSNDRTNIENYIEHLKELKPYSIHDNSEELMEPFKGVYYRLVQYKEESSKMILNFSKILSYSLFIDDQNSKLGSYGMYNLNDYFHDNMYNLIHPVAIRYLIYKIIEKLTEKNEKIKYELENCNKFFDVFDRVIFDDPMTLDKSETVEDLGKKDISFKDKLFHRLSDRQINLIDNYTKYSKYVNEYRLNLVLNSIYNDAIDYLTKISHAFEVMFNSLNQCTIGLNNHVDSFEEKYHIVDHKGFNDEIIDSFVIRVDMTDNVIRDILQEIDGYCALNEEEATIREKDYFNDLINQRLISYFNEEITKQFDEYFSKYAKNEKVD